MTKATVFVVLVDCQLVTKKDKLKGDSKLKKLVKFSRENCAPCKMVEGYLSDKDIQYQEVDVENDIETTVKYGVSGVPTLLLLGKNDEVLDRLVGFNPPKIDKLTSQL